MPLLTSLRGRAAALAFTATVLLGSAAPRAFAAPMPSDPNKPAGAVELTERDVAASNAKIRAAYSELASMVPISGSAYTYSYATLGELVAWIIGWDLIIEYAIGNVAVAISWAEFFNRLLRNLGIHMLDWLTSNYRTATD